MVLGNATISNTRLLNLLLHFIWQFHVVPSQAATEHTILTAIEATDSNVRRPAAMELLQCEGCLAAQAGRNVVLFSEKGETLMAASARVFAEATARIVIGDLAPSVDYTLSVGRTRIKLKATEAGTICAGNVAISVGDLIRVER